MAELAVWVLTAQLGLRARNLAKLAVMARRAAMAARVVSVEQAALVGG
jgi:hypothetical protein